MRSLLIAACFCIFGEIVEGQQAVEHFEEVAKKTTYFCTGDMLYRRVGSYGPDLKQYDHLLEGIYAADYDFNTLVNLLNHQNPTIRSFAIAALLAKERAYVLPNVATLKNDTALTLPEPQGMHTAFFARDPSVQLNKPKVRHSIPMTPQTVGDIAMKVLQFYMAPSGTDDFEEYWEQRKNRQYWAGWFAIQLNRATGGCSPVRETRIPAILNVRRNIDSIPEEDRAWTLLWLNGETGSDHLATEKELVSYARDLGPDRLLLMLQGKIPTDDPDLQSRDNNNWFYQRMILWVLNHASQLLRPQDSSALLQIEKQQGAYRTSYWAIAASELQTGKAKRILHDAFSRFKGEYDKDDRARLAAALWRLVGESEIQFLVDWFYSESPQRGQVPHCRVQFLVSIGESHGQVLAARIAQDHRFVDLDWPSFHTMLNAVNKWKGRPILYENDIDDELLRDLSHWPQLLRDEVKTWDKQDR